MTRIALDARRYGPVLLGDGGRVIRLTDAGAAALDDPPPALARRLIDAGLAHPLPDPVERPDVTVVVPVRDRPDQLDRCLEAAAGPALVVDDGSDDAAAIAAVAARHRARLLRRDTSGGPARARNAALVECTTELVAFLDSDTVAPPRWIERLAGHFADPRVAAVAPRVNDPALDMGARPANVKPGARVSYVPSAALLVRRGALGGGFDPDLRYGEDVDLVWRLHDRGWIVRYDPRVTVEHDATRLLARRFRYGMSAAPLARRHPRRLAPFLLAPVPTAILALLLARRPRLAALAFAAQSARLARRLRTLRLPLRLAPLLTARAVYATAEGILRGHPAYRAGVIAGALRHRTLTPLTPQRPRNDALPGPRSRKERIAHDVSSVANSSPTASGTIESAPRIPELT
jgi:mycofactocin system glycosyltransferase